MKEPKELAALFTKKIAALAEANKRKAQEAADKLAKIDEANEAGRKAIRGVVLPFLKDVQEAFPDRQFIFEAAGENGAKFRIRGREVTISISAGQVNITRQEAPRSRTMRTSATPRRQVDLLPNEELIKTPDDLTRENLSRLIEIEIGQYSEE
jgi:hypothetical protein